MFKAMDMESEYVPSLIQDIIKMIGSEPFAMEYLSLCLQDIATNKIYTSQDALIYLSNKIRASSYESNKHKNPVEEAREIISSTFLIQRSFWPTSLAKNSISILNASTSPS